MRRREIDPPGVFAFNRQMLYRRPQYYPPPQHQVFRRVHFTSLMHSCPSRGIYENVGLYPVHELHAARNELIDELYLTPNLEMMMNRIQELTGIIPNQNGVFIPAVMMPGRVTYEQQSTSQLSVPWPSPPSSDDDSDDDSIQEVEDEDSTHEGEDEYSSQNDKNVDNAETNIIMPSTSKNKGTGDNVIFIE